MKPSEKLLIKALKNLNSVGIILFATKTKNTKIGLYDYHEDADELTLGEGVSRIIVRVVSLLGTEVEEKKRIE